MDMDASKKLHDEDNVSRHENENELSSDEHLK